VGTNPEPARAGAGGLIPKVSVALGRVLKLVNPVFPLR
jgi:hypothetical protein